MSKKFLIFLSFVFVILLSITACGSPQADVIVEESQNNGSVSIKAGQVLEVRLSSNPETGNRWGVTSVDTAVLEQAGDPRFEEATEGNPAPAGMKGWGVFQFKAVAPGQTILQMVYQIPDSGSPEKSFTLQVIVE
jgi:predicted secreted protein